MLRYLYLLSSLTLLIAASLPAWSADIHKAAANGDVARVQELANANKSLIDSPDTSGATPMHWAVDRNQRMVVELLIALGANINARKKNGVTPLHVAAGCGRAELVELLVSSGADINAKDNYGRTPASLASYRRYREIADFLDAHGAQGAVDRPDDVNINASQSVSYAQAELRGCTVDIIYIDMNNPSVRVAAALPQNGVGRGESFGSFMQRLQPTAAINGTFFSNQSLKPIGDIVINGQLAHFGGMGTGLCITSDNKVTFTPVQRNRHTDWTGYETVICCGPRLVTSGQVSVDARGEGFKDPHVLGTARRMAVGLTNRNRLVFVSTRDACSLSTLAIIMSDIGCTDAINFDGGSSIAMHYRGKTITRPGRTLTNVLYVYERGRDKASK